MQIASLHIDKSNKLGLELIRRAKEDGFTNTNQLARHINVDMESLDRILFEGAKPNIRTRYRYDTYLRTGNNSPLEPKANSRRPANPPPVIAPLFAGAREAITSIRNAMMMLHAQAPALDELHRRLQEFESNAVIQELLSAPPETRAALQTLIRARLTDRYQRTGTPTRTTTTRTRHKSGHPSGTRASSKTTSRQNRRSTAKTR